MSILRLSWGISVLLISLGIFVPSSGLIGFLRPPPVREEFIRQLLIGAMLFKIALIMIGLWFILLIRLPIWESTFGDRVLLSNRHRPMNLVILSLILLVALGLRFYKLESGLWYDEILTYVNYVKMPFGEIITSYNDQNQHFLYTLLAHTSIQIFGDNAGSLRLPAVVFGVGSIWALYLFGRQVTSARESLLSAALLTFSYHHIWFSQNARGYIVLLFWTILSSWLLLKASRETKPQFWLLYAISVALGAYTHMTMLFVVTGQFTVYMIHLLTQRGRMWPDGWVGLLVGFCLAGLFTLLLYSFVIPQIFGGTLGQGAEKGAAVAVWKNPLWVISEFIRNMEISFASSVVAIFTIAIFGIGFWSYKYENPTVVLLLIVPIFVAVVVVKAMGHPLWPRLVFFSYGFGVLVVVRGTILLGERLTKSTTFGTILCVGLILISAISLPLVYAPKQDYQGALTYIKENREPGDAVVTLGVVATFPYKRFYKVDWEGVETLEDLNAARLQAKRTWLVYSMPVHVEALYPEIMASVRRDFTVINQFDGTLGGGTMFIFRSDIRPSRFPIAGIKAHVF